MLILWENLLGVIGFLNCDELPKILQGEIQIPESVQNLPEVLELGASAVRKCYVFVLTYICVCEC